MSTSLNESSSFASIFDVNGHAIFQGNTVAELFEEIKGWLESHSREMNIQKIYEDEEQALFTYSGEPLGICLTYSSTSMKLEACYGVYVTEKNSGEIVPHSTPVSDHTKTGPSGSSTIHGKYSLTCSKITVDGTTYYTMGIWYCVTALGGTLVGLYTDDIKTVFLDYPAYFGKVTNDLLHEELVYTVQINRGANALPGDDASTSNSVSSGMSTGRAYIVGEGNIEPTPSKRTKYSVFLQSIRRYVTDAPYYSIIYTPLIATLSTWCKAFQVDDFFSGAYNTSTYPPVMENLTVDGQSFFSVSHDGVALKIRKSEEGV